MITLTIEAKNAEELRTQLHALLGASAVVALAKELTEPEEKTPAKRGRPKKSRDPLEPLEPSQSGMAPEGSAKDGEIATTENVGDLLDQGFVNETSDEIATSIDAEAAKAEVLPKLRDLFVSGQVKQLRAILDKFGDGAGSIPEIDAKHFPAIKEFLAQGALQ